jgi:hypothetical protein
MEARLNQFGPKVKRGMVAAANYVAPLAEAYMKENAPWTDQTGAARNGLSTQVIVATNKVAIVLYHTVPYGVFLEVRWGGKYSVIPAAMAATGPLFVEAIQRLAFND